MGKTRKPLAAVIAVQENIVQFNYKGKWLIRWLATVI